MAIFFSNLHLLILVLILAYLHEQTTAATETEYKWVKSSKIEPIANYDPTSISATPYPPSNSGFETAMNQKGDTIAIASRLFTEGDEQGYVFGGVVNVYKQQNYSAGESNADKVWEPLGAEIIVSTDGAWNGKNILSFNEDGTMIAIGSRSANNKMGQAQVLRLDPQNNIWSLVGGEELMSGTQIGEEFGAAVGLSADGTTLVVGSPFYSEVSSTGETLEKVGRVSIFIFDSSIQQWISSKINLIGEASKDEFGTSLALSAKGDLLAVGAPLNDGDETSVFGGRRLNGGHVRVYKQEANGVDWIQLGSDINGEQYMDFSGSSLAMSYNVDRPEDHKIAVGAPDNDGLETSETFDGRGHVRVFGYDESAATWEKLYYDIDGESRGDNSGYSVALDRTGSRLIVGGILSDGVDGNTIDAGHARIFEVGYRGWTQVGNDLDGEESSGHFGTSVQINGSGNRVIVGAPLVGDPGRYTGAVYVYDLIEISVQDPPDGGRTSGSYCFRVWNSLQIGLLAMLYLIF